MSQKLKGTVMEILLVEDNLDDARVTIEALREGGVRCRVTLVRDGDEAMRFVRCEGVFSRAPRPDLILLDIELPKKDGHQVLAEIRADDTLREIPVVVLTASAVHKVVFEAQNLRVDDYMTKPVNLEKFVQVVKSLRQSWLAEFVFPPCGGSKATV